MHRSLQFGPVLTCVAARFAHELPDLLEAARADPSTAYGQLEKVRAASRFATLEWRRSRHDYEQAPLQDAVKQAPGKRQVDQQYLNKV
eukprot:3417999-Amphidinium_carterae.1